MLNLPDYIDNDSYKLEAALRDLIQTFQQTHLDIATGFFRIEAWARLEDSFNQLTHLRILIGRDPAILPAERDTIDLQRYFRREIQKQLDQQDYNSDYKATIVRLIAYLHQDHIHIRLYGVHGDKTQFLHAKAYIFDYYCIVGSSNFTPAGLQGNTELNVLIKSQGTTQDLRQNWFAKFWDHPSVDLDYKTKLIDALNASKFGSKPYTPYQVFVKALYELFKDDAGIPGSDTRTALELASFQQEGFERAVRLLERHHGVMVADAVGLGKTFIGLRLLDHYLTKERRPGHVPRALIICPAQLRDLVWNKRLDDYGLKADIISQEELGRQTFDTRPYSRFDIILIDESHNFRNPGTNRYQTLQRLIGSGKRNKRIILLTATPINNTVYDLYHQILLLTRNDDRYYRTWGISNLKGYFRDLNKGAIEITELLLQTMVRRSRQDVVKRQKTGEIIKISGKEIHFPTRQLERFTYNFEQSHQGLYANLSAAIETLNLTPYNIKSFKRRRNQADNIQIQCNQALLALMKTLYLKRMESSLTAFENSITSQQRFQSRFLAILQTGRLLDSATFRKIIALETDEEESKSTAIDDLLDTLPTVDPSDYNIEHLQEHIQTDLTTLTGILTRIQAIRTAVSQGTDYDRKLIAFKTLLQTHLIGRKILVFSYFKDTADYLYQQLKQDPQWLAAMGSPRIEVLTGSTSGKQREERVKRFAPLSNCETEEQRAHYQSQEIDILICTDVLSEGQNLQDAGVLVNYDLHWNPVRMIQRAGRIDRLGTSFRDLFIYNCFPEEGLENLLNLVQRLQQRIAIIDREVGLDASVLGEVISDRSLEELRKLKEADTQAEKQALLEELEQASDLASIDEMRFPLLEFINQVGQEAAEEIPMGIHSTKNTQTLDGIFLAFKVEDRHFWHFYPRIDGHISTDPVHLVAEKRQIFRWLHCKSSDYPNPDELPPTPFDNAIFAILQSATTNLLESLKKKQTSGRLRPQLTKLLSTLYQALTHPDLLNASPLDPDIQVMQERILQVIQRIPLRTYEKDIRQLWQDFKDHRQLKNLIADLDELFVDQDIYQDIEDETQPTAILRTLKKQDIQLVCYQWFKPNS